MQNDRKSDERWIASRGKFWRTSYVGGDRVLLVGVDADLFTYNDLMQEVKVILKLREIGGVYAVDNDIDVIQVVENCKDGEEVKFYVDNIVDTTVEPLVAIQPNLILRPRKNMMNSS